VDRARVRTTLTYQATERLRVGLEYNPQGHDLGVLANWRVVDETPTRPAVILGTSSARIGTEDGRAIYATASKDLSAWLDVPVSPYLGVAWDGGDHKLQELAGVVVGWSERVSSTHFYDGENLHHMLGLDAGDGVSVGLVLAEVDGERYLGATAGFRFGGFP
jgi:hypothetical protein